MRLLLCALALAIACSRSPSVPGIDAVVDAGEDLAPLQAGCVLLPRGGKRACWVEGSWDGDTFFRLCASNADNQCRPPDENVKRLKVNCWAR